MAINSWSSIQNINNLKLQIWKKEFNLINRQPYIDKIYLCAKDLNEAKYQFLIKKHENAGTKHFNDSKAFIEYSNDMDNIYKNIEEYNSNKKYKIIVFDDMIA